MTKIAWFQNISHIECFQLHFDSLNTIGELGVFYEPKSTRIEILHKSVECSACQQPSETISFHVCVMQPGLKWNCVGGMPFELLS